jgi:flavin reductase (DIM6/NTAB) family NADH-FMN oxidoreductase RutF
MRRKKIAVKDFSCLPLDILANQWMLLASGDFSAKNFNMMTVGWGGFGTMWGKPFCMVVVRPGRHTYQFMEKSSDFTISAFPDDCKRTLGILGSASGRDMDKINSSGFTPIASTSASSPGFDEAELIIECKKIYFDDFKPENFLDPEIENCYPDKDYHRMYFGEVQAIFASDKYLPV